MKLAAVKRNITPQFPVPLAANGDVKNRVFHKVDSTLEVNAMRLETDDKDVILLSVDTLFVSEEVKTFCLDFLSKKFHFNEEQLFLSASHTHYAPMIDQSKSNLGIVNDDYMAWFYEELKYLLEELMTKPTKPVIIKYSKTVAVDLSISRRKKAWGFFKKIIPSYKMKLYPNKKTDIDRDVYIINFYNLNESEILATCWSFACHPVMYHSQNNITSHFPGAIRDSFRKSLNKEYPILFFQGFSGDIRPQNFNQSNNLKSKVIKIINSGRSFSDFTNQTYQKWIENLRENLLGNFQSSQTVLNDLDLKIVFEKIKLSKVFETKVDQDITFHSISLSDEFVLIAVSAEVVSKYAIKIKQLFPNKIIIPIGCYGQVFGYWPTKKMLSEKGYESNEFFNNFSLNGHFKDNVEDVLMDYLNKIVESNTSVK